MSKNQAGFNVPFKNGQETIKSPDNRLMSLSHLSDFISNLEGRILTVTDAVVSDKEQNKATKSLFRNLIWDEFDVVRKWYYEQDDNGATPFPYGPQVPRLTR